MSSSMAPTARPRRAFAWTGPCALFESLDPADQADFRFDPAVIEWRHYIEDVHLPSVVEHARVRTSPTARRTMATREERSLKAILSERPRCAAFDLENTLIASNVVESYAWLATRHLERAERAASRGRPVR